MIIQRYLFKEFLPPFGISLAFFSFIFIMMQLPDIANYVVNFQIGLSTVGLLLLYTTPYFLQFTIPMSVMIAVLISFLRMSGDMEIVALKSSGVHLNRLLPPVLIFGLIGALLTAYMGIFAMPEGRKASKQLLYDVASSHVEVGLKSRQFIDMYKGVVIYINEIDSDTRLLSDIFIEDRRSKKMRSTVLASRGRLIYDPDQEVGNLRLFNGTIHQVDLARKHANAIRFETYDLRLDVSGNLRPSAKGKEHVREMRLSTLWKTIQSAKRKDGDYYKALKEWHRKFSLPGACMAMAVLAMPLGIRARTSKRAYGIGLGLFFFLLYYVMLSIGWVLSESGVYPPVVGMWAPNAVIFGIGVALLVYANKEKSLLDIKMPNFIRSLNQRFARKQR